MLMSWFISRSNGSRSGSLINEHLQPVKWECCVKFSDAKCSQLPEVAFEADVHSDIQLPFATGIQPATLIEVVAPMAAVFSLPWRDGKKAYYLLRKSVDG
jgi:hypothetical protein